MFRGEFRTDRTVETAACKKNEQNIRLQQEKEALCQQMEGEHEKIAKVVEKNKYVTTPMKEIESFYEAYCQERVC